jgi:hypothetical protein
MMLVGGTLAQGHPPHFHHCYDLCSRWTEVSKPATEVSELPPADQVTQVQAGGAVALDLCLTTVLSGPHLSHL